MRNYLKQFIALCGLVVLGLTLSLGVPAWADVIDSDGFDDNNWTSDQGNTWARSPGSGQIIITTETFVSASRSAEMGNNEINIETLELAVDTSGYTDIVFSYNRAEGGSHEAADYFLSEWYDGSAWISAMMIGEHLSIKPTHCRPGPTTIPILKSGSPIMMRSVVVVRSPSSWTTFVSKARRGAQRRIIRLPPLPAPMAVSPHPVM